MSDLLRMLRLARPLRGRLALAVLAGAVTVGAATGLLALSGWLLARASQHPPLAVLSIAVVGVRFFGVTRGLARYAERLTTHDVAFRVLAGTRTRVYRRLTRLAPDRLRGLRASDLLTRLVSDVDAVQDLLVRGVVPPLAAALAGAAATGLVAAVLLPAGLVLAAGLLLAGLVLPAALAYAAARPGRDLVRARARLGRAVAEVLDGAAELMAYGATGPALAEVAAAEDAVAAAARRSTRIQAAGALVATLLAGGTVWAVLLVGIGPLGTVPLAVVALTALAAFEAVAPLPAAAAQLAAAAESGSRLFAVLDDPHTAPHPVRPRPLPGGPYTLTVRNPVVPRAPALSGMDLTLTPGRRVALVGTSGSGKTTLASVLFRFLDVDGGIVELNGVPIAELDPDAVRTVIGGLPADSHLFDTTLRENLRLARPDASVDDLRDAARRARLLDWIEGLPDGWDTRVGRHGDLMSGGERQRLALARALLADPPILVLDEPTAHLDDAAAAALTDDLLTATAGRTVLLITHDHHGLDAVDQVVRLALGPAARDQRPGPPASPLVHASTER